MIGAVQSKRIELWTQVGRALCEDTEEMRKAVEQATQKNPWFTQEDCIKSLEHWSALLKSDNLMRFVQAYPATSRSARVGVVMAGNIPLVGLHDLLCVSLSGHDAAVKTSSEDSVLPEFIISLLHRIDASQKEAVTITTQLPKQIDGVIATGSNSSYRYFEYYFRNLPHILRKNRRSFAVLDGTESEAELRSLASDVFSYFGLGCRNVSLLWIPANMEIASVLDNFMDFAHLADHNRFANNYTYHKALFLMNQQQHLDTGFVLVKEEASLQAPLGCIFVARYQRQEEVDAFLREHNEEVQCVVGKNYKQADVEFGKSQQPQLHDFADKVDSMQFLASLGSE